MASSQTIAEAVENSLNAFNIISKKNLEAVSYDQTIKCKIVDITNRDLGEYKVTDGSSTFTAYSEKTDYIKGTLVWVTIPLGDYNKQKIISGKYIESDNSEYYTYVSPLDSFIDISQNLIEPGMINTTGLIANGEVEEITLWSIYGREYKGYDRLAIQAGFKSWLKQLNVKSGTYGLRLDITSKVMGTSQTSNDRKFYSIVLNTNDFYGDVYNFETFYNQVKVIDISMIDCIDSMSLVFYQGKDFKVSETEPLKYANPSDIQNDIDLSNIWVNNPYISLGYDVSRFTTDTVLLYTLDSATYASFLSERMKDYLEEALDQSSFDTYEEYIQAVDKIHNDDGIINQTLNRLNRKNMQVRWIHFPSEDSKPIVISTSEELHALPEQAILHWYHYKLDEGIKDQLAGTYWEEITSLKDTFEYNNFYPDIANQSEKFKVIIELPSQESKARHIYDENMFQEYFSQDTKERNETYYEWVCRGLDTIEELKMEVVGILYSQNRLEEKEDEIYEEYLQALEEEAVLLGLDSLSPTDAAANKINEIYRKKMMNIKTELENQQSLYTNIYNDIIKVLGEVKYYYSDILEFTCEDLLPNNMTLQLIKGLQLIVDEDGYNGCYRIYNDEGQILSKKESQKKRVITASWTSLVTGDRGLDGIERIEWYIPVKNTMIEYPQEGIEYTSYDEYPIGNKVEFDTSRDRQLYTYDKEHDIYEPILPATQFEHGKKYYVKNNTTFSPPTAERPDTFKIVRAGSTFENHEAGTEEPSMSGQIFRVKEFYSPTFTNNTIKCIVRKNNSPFEAEAELVFGPTGTNGTDYTFELEIANKVQALTAGQSNPESTITIIPHLYDYNGEDIIKQYVNKLKYSWWSPSSPKITIKGNANTNALTGQVYYLPDNMLNGSIELSLETNLSIEDVQYHILYAELTNAVNTGIRGLDGTEQSITLTTFKPIAVRSSEKYVTIDGADKVSYDSSGVNPSYYQDPYVLYIYKNKATIPIEQDDEAEETPIKWEVSLGKDTIGAIAGSVAKEFYPTLSKEYALVPPSYFLQDNGKQVAINCRDKNDEILWTQPLYIYQNSYTSTLLNSWDGKLTIDEENGTILSTVVGAGAKDEKNRYNGVLMGDLRDVDNTKTFGLYGYSEGVQSFGFKIDGTAFIGKSGKGQINFDGNSGRISSLSYNLPYQANENEHYRDRHQGMMIDLDDGYIEAYGANLKNIRYAANNRTYTIDEVLELQKEILEQEMEDYDNSIRPLNQWADKVLIQRYTNRKQRAQEKYNNAIKIINDFATQTFNNDYEKLKYLQDKGATYLINDDVFTPQYEESNSKIRFSTTDPYLVITSENSTDLMKISKNIYFLQTDNFVFARGEKDLYPYEDENFLNCFRDKDSVPLGEDDYGTGMLFDLSHGYLLGYNFKLKSVNNGQMGDNQAKAMKDSYFELNSSGDPFLVIHFKTIWPAIVNPLKTRGLLPNDATFLEKNLMWVSRDKFYLQSFNFFPHAAEVDEEFVTTEIAGTATNAIDPKKVGAGVALDLTNGRLIGHDFEISAVDTGTAQTIVTNFEEGTIRTEPAEPQYTGSYVFLGSSGKPYFRIHYQNVPDTIDRENYGNPAIWDQLDENGIRINKNIDLINISKSAWEINSKDFQRPDSVIKSIGKGIHFDLEGTSLLSLNSNGTANRGSFIEAYAFGLDAYRPGLTEQDPSSRIRINSAASGNFDTTQGDMGYITGYTVNYNYLSMPGEKTYNNAETIWEIIDKRYINKAAFEAALALYEGDLYYCPIETYTEKFIDNPLMIGGLFSVSWDGKLKSGWIEATQGGQIGPFTLSSFALFTNEGLLANGKNFIPVNTHLTQKEREGIYFGIDGLSFSDKIAIYRNPINRYQNVQDNKNTNETHTLKKPTTILNQNTQNITYNYEYDYVTSGYYGDVNLSDYFLNVGHSYDQIFQVDGVNYALKNLSFFLNGNSVLNGVTAINGNTYIYGNLQIGVPKDIGEDPSDTGHAAIVYANTSVYGIFRTTGKTFIGDKDAKWTTSVKALRNDARVDRNALDETDAELGTIIYRNTYLSGYLKVAGSLSIGEANIPNIQGSMKYDDMDIHGDFTAYVISSKFWGDVEVAGGFVAGSKKSSGGASGNLPQVPTPDGSLQEGSGIQAEYTFLGRAPEVGKNVHSDLAIYANTEQWGSFIAGRHGEKIELYAGGNYNSSQGYDESFIIMDQNNGIQINTYTGKDFKLTTNGGTVTIDGRDSGQYAGGNIYLYAGQNKNLHLIAGNSDYIKFTNGALEVASTGSLEIKVTNSYDGTTQIFKIDSSGIEIKGSGDFKLTAGNNELSLNNNGITLKGDGDFNLSCDAGSFTMNSGGIKLSSNDGPYLEMTANDISISTGSTSFKASNDGTLYLSGSLVEMEAPANVRGDLHVYGNIYANNLNVAATNSPGTIGAPDVKVPPISAGIGAGWIAGWLINKKTLQSEEGHIGLDPDEAKIWFNGPEVDYVDGGGSGNSNEGLTLHSSNAIWIKSSVVYFSDGNSGYATLSSGVSPGLMVKDSISYGDTLYLGSTTTGDSYSPHANYYKVDNQANIYCHSINVVAGTDGNNVYFSADYAGDVKLSSIELGSATSNTEILIKSPMKMENNDAFIVTDIQSSQGTLTIKGYGGLSLETQSGQIDFKPSGGNSTAMTVASSYINLYEDVNLSSEKDFKFYVNGSEKKLSELKALAFAEDLKKKFNISLYYRNSGGSTLYIDTLASDPFYQLKSNPTTIYKLKSYNRPDIYTANFNSTPSIYEYSGYHTVYKRGSSYSAYSWDWIDDGLNHTYGSYFKSFPDGTYYEADGSETVYEYDSANIWDYFDSASIDDIADEADIDDIATRKKFTWNLNETSEETTFVSSTSTSDTIYLDNGDFNLPIELTINTYNY